jgi:hypothetical protein
MSAYAEEEINKLLCCGHCKLKFDLYDEPKIIPCGISICSKCEAKINAKLSDKLNFKCLNETECLEEHLKPTKGFPVNRAIVQLLLTEPKEIYRGERIENLKSILKEIEIMMNSFLAINHRQIIKEHCNELKNKVQLSTEEKIVKLTDLNESFMKQIETYETKCIKTYENNVKTRVDEILSREIAKVKEFVEKKTNFLKKLDKIDENEIIQSKCIADGYLNKLKQLRKDLKNQIFNNEFLGFEATSNEMLDLISIGYLFSKESNEQTKMSLIQNISHQRS